MGVTELFFESLSLKSNIKGVSNRSYCCYGTLLCQKKSFKPCSSMTGHLFDATIKVMSFKDW